MSITVIIRNNLIGEFVLYETNCYTKWCIPIIRIIQMNRIERSLEKFKTRMFSEEMSENTLKSYISDVRCFFRWYQEIDSGDNLKNITSYHIKAYKDHMVHGKRKKTSSINRSIQSLKNFFYYLA